MPSFPKSQSSEFLRTIPLFSELSSSELHLLFKSSDKSLVGKGNVVLQEGDPGDHLLIILSGRVKVSLLGKGGKEFILAILGPGSFLGEMALLESTPRSATVSTIESSVFLRLNQPNFTVLLHKHPLHCVETLEGPLYTSARDGRTLEKHSHVGHLWSNSSLSPIVSPTP